MPQKLTDHQNLELALGLAKGEKPWDLAQKVGCAPKTVYQRMKDPEFMTEVAGIADRGYHELPTKFRGAVIAAFETILALSQAADRDSTRLTAAKMVLEYAGVQPPKPEDVGGSVGDEPIYAIRGDDGIYRPIVLLPGGKVEVEEPGTS